MAAVLLLGLLTAGIAHAVDTLTITPSTDPGDLMVGDTLEFTVSVDSVTPPEGGAWGGMVVFAHALNVDALTAPTIPVTAPICPT